VNWKHQFIFTVLSICLLAGCSTNKETIQFSSEPAQPPDYLVETATPSPKKLDLQNLLKVQLAVYGYLLQRHFWNDHDYSAVFIQDDADRVEALIKKFPHHVPPIKTSDHAQLHPDRTPVDTDTGRPAMLLSVDALDLTGDTVEAIGRWYAGAAVSGFYTFSLRKIGDDWVIESVR
jgi:hypothetical protein